MVEKTESEVRSLSIKCFYRDGCDFLIDSIFSTLWGHNVHQIHTLMYTKLPGTLKASKTFPKLAPNE